MSFISTYLMPLAIIGLACTCVVLQIQVNHLNKSFVTQNGLLDRQIDLSTKLTNFVFDEASKSNQCNESR